jgi:hypothetical protein
MLTNETIQEIGFNDTKAFVGTVHFARSAEEVQAGHFVAERPVESSTNFIWEARSPETPDMPNGLRYCLVWRSSRMLRISE